MNGLNELAIDLLKEESRKRIDELVRADALHQTCLNEELVDLLTLSELFSFEEVKEVVLAVVANSVD